ncbi:DUF1754-domain-containing protein [Calocera viscosa TUFC12733]|uniref:DUF1754-domain-containing protein n=1 Tax=Calocera viscosa (strain TUFC12733) TaxID=1330018 RepID=A0A167LSJ3_CALVF|nr:DUF1754-domain-containing protein [Calocera viscosa TUFC12733]
MADYDFRPGGSLKLKGGDAGGKKKKKSKTKETMKESLLKGKARESEGLSDEPTSSAVEDVDADADAPTREKKKRDDNKTEAERRFEERQRRMLERKVEQMAKKTHKDRVHEFNAKLETLSEHHDIPKVGPG